MAAYVPDKYRPSGSYGRPPGMIARPCPYASAAEARKAIRRRFSKAKRNREELQSAVDAYDRIQKVSDEIRARHSLPPVEEGPVIQGLRAELEAKGKPRKRKAAPAKREAELTATQRLDAIAKRRRELERERERLDVDLAALVADTQAGHCEELTVSAIARKVGLTRQRLYQLG